MNSPLTRRSFLASSAAAAALAALPTRAAAPAPRKKVALLGTMVRPLSHAQHFLDRFTLGYTWNGGWHRPSVDLVSLYIDQFPGGDDDLARRTAKRFNVPLFPSIAETLTMGTGKLAVDGVVIIAEHGRYPKNEKGQTLYPRYKFFKEVVKVFEASGRSVPVFNDKHLSTDWRECVEMVEDSKRLKFPFHAGSSLPVTRRLPAIDLPFGTPLSESLCVCYGGLDSYDFHGLEVAQCMSERRKGGEVGISRVLALRGAEMWEHAAKRPETQRLLVAALCRSHNLPVKDAYPTDAVSFEWARANFPEGWGYFIDHRDGFRTTLMMLPPIRDMNYAGLNSQTGEIISCQMYLPMPERGSTTADFFNPLVHHTEQMIRENRAPYPIERTLLTSGMTLAGVESFHRGGPVETPEMAVKYTGPKESTFWRD